MSYSNGLLSFPTFKYDISGKGEKGDPGVGFKLTEEGDYDMENKKLVNAKNGDGEDDVMVKRQVEGFVNNKTQYLDGVLPAQVLNNKAVIYSPSGGVQSNALYLKDSNGQEVHFYTENQDDNQIRLYIPNLKNNDSYGGRLKSSILVSSIEQTIEGKKVFSNIEVPKATKDTHAANKKYVDNELWGLRLEHAGFVLKSGDTMTGDLIIPKESYPIPKDLNKAINYSAQRDIFLSIKEGGQMSQPIDMNNNFSENLKTPTANDHATNKSYVDTNFLENKGGIITGPISMSRFNIIDLPDTPKLGDSAVNRNYVTKQLDTKLDKTFKVDLAMGGYKIENVGTPLTYENDTAVNVMFFNRELNASNANLVKTITNQYKKCVDDSHVSPSNSQKRCIQVFDGRC